MPIVLVSKYSSSLQAGITLDLATLLEHAFRRVKVHPSEQTPETVQLAKETLYLMLLNLANRGLNLWWVESDFIGMQNGRAVYPLDSDTIDVLNVVYSQPTRATGTDATTSTSITTELASATSIKRIGAKFSTLAATETIALLTSADGVTWTSQVSDTRDSWATDTWYWWNLPITEAVTHFKLSTTAAMVTTEFYLASAIADLPVVQWNRDTWAVINNKNQPGRPSTNYYLERLLVPQLTLWPVPNNNYDHIQVFLQREVASLGALSDTIEVPKRDLDGIIWMLALRLAYELPQVNPAIIPSIQNMADKVLLEMEHNEGDGAPILMQPNIGVYTR